MSPSEYVSEHDALEAEYQRWRWEMFMSELPADHPIKLKALAEKRKRQMNTVFGILLLLGFFAVAWMAWLNADGYKAEFSDPHRVFHARQ